MKKLIIASALALSMSALFAVSSVAATTWTTIAHSQTSGNSGSAGSALSSSPSGLRIELVTTDASSSYVFWTDTCSASGTPSVHYGMYNLPTNATSYHSL